MKHGPGKISVLGDIAENLGWFDPRGRCYSALSAKLNGDVGDAIERAERRLEAENNLGGLGAAIGQCHPDEYSAGIWRRAPGQSGVEAVDRQVGAGNPEGDEIPGRIAECEGFSVGGEIRLKNWSAVLAADLQQATMMHGQDVECSKRGVDGADVRERDPLVSTGQNVVGAQGHWCTQGCGEGRRSRH